MMALSEMVLSEMVLGEMALSEMALSEMALSPEFLLVHHHGTVGEAKFGHLMTANALYVIKTQLLY
jgi:hypothetical protein